MKTPIIFSLGEETKHIVENVEDVMETSPFSDQYKKALSSLDGIIAAVSSETELRKRDGDDIAKACINNPVNNIITFVGDRGSGKTSCMMSLVKLLSHNATGLRNKYQHVERSSFYCADRIDPAFFDERHNVIEIFLANLFNDVTRCYRQNYCRVSENSYNETLELFAEAEKILGEMTKPSPVEFDALESIQNLSAGTQFSWTIMRLAKSALRCLKNEDSFLVLPIDDLDLNNRMAAQMLEQIRKYLMVPNIIVLLSLKIDQMALAKRLHLKEDYSALLSKQDKYLDEAIEQMVDSYMTKTLPHNQRVYMPDGEGMCPVIIKDGESGQIMDTFPTIRQMIPELIFKKTRYLFYNSIDKTSFIVPKNLREIRILVNLLYGMPDYWGAENNISASQEKHESDSLQNNAGNTYNKFLFRKYFY